MNNPKIVFTKVRGFFQPAIAIMNRLKYPQKFLLISLLFSIPLSLVLILLLAQIQIDLNLSKDQLSGNRLLRPVQTISNQLFVLEILSNRNPYPNPVPPEFIPPSQAIDQAIEDFQIKSRASGFRIQTTPQFQNLTQTWTTLKENQRFWSPETKQVIYKRLEEQLRELKTRLATRSDLLLATRLEIYYLNLIVLDELPEIQRLLSKINLIFNQIQANQQMTPLQRAEITAILGVLESEIRDFNRNLSVSFQVYPKLQTTLEFTLENFNTRAAKLTRFSQELIYSLENFNVFNQLLTVEITFDSSVLLWQEINQVLDEYLQENIQKVIQDRLLIFSLITVSLVVVIYLFIGFYLGVMQTVLGISTTTRQMLKGDFNTVLNLSNRDELAEVVKSFNKVATALVNANQEITHLNEQLKVDNIRMSTELDITRQLQKMILPSKEELQEVFGLDIAGFMQPAQEVGGDYYDVLQYNGKVIIAIGDVTGHGLESGVVMLMVQTAVRALSAVNETNSVKFLSALNQAIYSNIQRMKSYKNMTLAILSYEDGILRLSGQHETLIVVRNTGEIENIDTFDLGFPLGLESDISDFISEVNIHLQIGEIAVLYTDGITEAFNQDSQQYGLERMYKVLRTNYHRSAQEICEVIIKDLQEHIGQQTVFDDITLLVLKQK